MRSLLSVKVAAHQLAWLAGGLRSLVPSFTSGPVGSFRTRRDDLLGARQGRSVLTQAWERTTFTSRLSCVPLMLAVLSASSCALTSLKRAWLSSLWSCLCVCPSVRCAPVVSVYRRVFVGPSFRVAAAAIVLSFQCQSGLSTLG